MKPYYQDDLVTIYNRDCRELPDELFERAVVTGPPWFENIELARQVIATFTWATEAIIQWSEVTIPFCKLPWVATYIWVHMSQAEEPTERYQPFYHFAADGRARKSHAVFYSTVTPQLAEYVGHPHQFRQGLAIRLIQKTSPELVIVDPFMGSGTTLIAARDLGRKAVGIEINEAYCAMAVRRLKG